MSIVLFRQGHKRTSRRFYFHLASGWRPNPLSGMIIADYLAQKYIEDNKGDQYRYRTEEILFEEKKTK